MTFALETEGLLVGSYCDLTEMLIRRRSDATCIVIDIEPDGTDPLASLAQLRRAGVTDPTIIVASDLRFRLRERVAAAGAILIEKPLLCDSLMATIRQIAGEV